MEEVTRVDKVCERLVSLVNIIIDGWSKKEKLQLYNYLIKELTNKKGK